MERPLEVVAVSRIAVGGVLQAVADANRGKWNAKLAFLQGVVYANAKAY